MTESRRTSRPDSSGAKAPGGSRRPPRPLNSAGRPVSGFGRAAPNGSGDAARDGEAATDREQVRGDAAPDWERIREAAGRAAAAGPAPPAGGGAPSLSSLLLLLEALRGMLPRELEKQFSALVREALLTLRALIDWYLERLDGEGPERRVEDIPID
jgi:hypothetical protein